MDRIGPRFLTGGVHCPMEVPADHVLEAGRAVDRRGVTPLEDVNGESGLEELPDDAPVGPEVEDRRIVDEGVDDNDWYGASTAPDGSYRLSLTIASSKLTS